jgi:predicted Zn-dependent protease
LQIAGIQLQNGRIDQAAAMLRAVLDQQQIDRGQRTAAMWMLGSAYARGERWPEAAILLAAAADQRPMRAEDWYRVAYTCYRAGEFPLAQQAAEAALQSQGDYAPAQNLLAQLPVSLPDVPTVQTASGTESDAPY